MPRSNQPVAAVIALATQDCNSCRPGRRTSNKRIASVRHTSSGGFHELKTRDAVTFRRQPVDLAHLGSGENFHGFSGLENVVKIKMTALRKAHYAKRLTR